MRGGGSQTNRGWTWEGLAAATLRRQFPRLRGRGSAAVVDLVSRVGPLQSQAARAPFLCVASRLPGATYAAITESFASSRLVRSTSLRGTVHTSTREHHGDLNAVATRALAGLWRRTLRLDQAQLEDFWAELERLSDDDWVTHDVIETRMRDWFLERSLTASLAAIEVGAGRFAFRGHAAMLRRPRSTTSGWDSQAEVVYRSARFAIDEQPVTPQEALVELVRRHIAASGPLSRRDLAWWSGEGLRNVDAAVESLRAELVARPGPNGLDYLDLAEVSARPVSDPGIRLLPEYDALLLAYDPAARKRFADDDAVLHSWNRANGVHSPTVLVQGRLRGRWRLTRSGGTAAVDVEMFPGERLLDPGDLAAPVDAVGAALGITITDVTVTHVTP